MNLAADRIEQLLNDAGYRTTRVQGEVSVYDPVQRSGPNGKLFVDHHDLVEIRSVLDAIDFIDERG